MLFTERHSLLFSINSRKEKKVEIEEIVEYINFITPPRLLRFVSEKGENSCDECQKYHGLIFEENAKDIPQIPIHPNCRCKYEYVSKNDLVSIRKNIENISTLLDNWAEQIRSQGEQLSRDVDNIVLGIKNTKKEIELNVLITSLQYAITAAEKIKLAEDALKKESNKLQIKINFLGAEVKSLATAVPDWISALKKLHYFRLKEFDQRLENLPQSPEEAIKRGFTKAAPNENWYHRGKGQIDNEKYYHKITGQEVVFDKNGKIVTDHENIGTKNYGTNPKSWEHVKFDVIPYYIWGNSPDDTTPLFRRIFGYH